MTAPTSPSSPRGFVVAAPNSNTGKTVFTLGLIAALRHQGLSVRAAKAGPGFIDPQFLSLASAEPCQTLDKWAMGAPQIRARAANISKDHDVMIVEGMMGLFDGASSIDGSTADIASTLDLPILFVIDASGQAQSIAALVHGFSTFRNAPKFGGIVATRVGSPGHADLLRDALADSGIPFLGALERAEALEVPSRHLGLVQADEHPAADALLIAARDAVLAGLDLEATLAMSAEIGSPSPVAPLPPLGQRIAIARDAAFGFAYPHQFDDWRSAGATLSFFSPLADEAPRADCDAIFLPGGYPELHAATLSQATHFLSALRAAADRKVRIYGECGGYMVLGEALIDGDGSSHRMAGLLSHVTSFAARKMHLGYRRLEPLQTDLWAQSLRGHEFHYSSLIEPGTDSPLFEQFDATGKHLGPTGGRRGSVFGSYAHIIDQAPAII